jgi:hypothetical protein
MKILGVIEFYDFFYQQAIKYFFNKSLLAALPPLFI